jgi:hypothetical protein
LEVSLRLIIREFMTAPSSIDVSASQIPFISFYAWYIHFPYYWSYLKVTKTHLYHCVNTSSLSYICHSFHS